MSAAYTDSIRQWATDDRRAGTLSEADGTGEVGLDEGEIGRRLAVRFALRMCGDRAEMVRYQVFGCGFTIAACAAAAELAEGHSLAEIAAITAADVDFALAGLPPERDYCANLAVAALQAAVKSAGTGRQPITVHSVVEDDHTPRVTKENPVYNRLVGSPLPPGAPPEDRHLFACLIAVAASETSDVASALGLSWQELDDLLSRYFPGMSLADLDVPTSPSASPPPPVNPDIRDLLASFLPTDTDGRIPAPSLWLARILAARAAHSGHLWRAMGLFTRPELTEAIRRHLPGLVAANAHGMRWKRFFFKQVCERSGGVMCKSPDCGACSDFALCFAAE